MLGEIAHSFCAYRCNFPPLYLCVCLFLKLTCPSSSASSPVPSPTIRTQLRYPFSTRILCSTSWNQSFSSLKVQNIFKFFLWLCNIIFHGTSQRQKHWLTVHTNEEKYEACGTCNSTYMSLALQRPFQLTQPFHCSQSGNKGSVLYNRWLLAGPGQVPSPRMTSPLAI